MKLWAFKIIFKKINFGRENPKAYDCCVKAWEEVNYFPRYFLAVGNFSTLIGTPPASPSPSLFPPPRSSLLPPSLSMTLEVSMSQGCWRNYKGAKRGATFRLISGGLQAILPLTPVSLNRFLLLFPSRLV